MDSCGVILGDELLWATLFSESFDEFCSDLDELDVLCDPEIHMEAVSNSKTKYKIGLGKMVKNTVDTTASVGHAYGNVTDAGATVIKNIWDLFMRAVHLASKILVWMSNRLADIPRMILSVMDKVGQIPNEIRNRIKGNIQLYIRVDDIHDIYNREVMVKVDSFMACADALAKGEMWGTFFHHRKDGKIPFFKGPGRNDMAYCKKMHKIYSSMKGLQFDSSWVEMNKKNIDIYFTRTASVKFTDLSGRQHQCSYFEALVQIVKDLQAQKDRMKTIQQLLGQKLDITKQNQAFASLSQGARDVLVQSISDTSKVINVIGNVVKYVMRDMRTIESATKKLIKKDKVNEWNTGVQAAKP